jgi:hypothetical protein
MEASSWSLNKKNIFFFQFLNIVYFYIAFYVSEKDIDIINI